MTSALGIRHRHEKPRRRAKAESRVWSLKVFSSFHWSAVWNCVINGFVWNGWNPLAQVLTKKQNENEWNRSPLIYKKTRSINKSKIIPESIQPGRKRIGSKWTSLYPDESLALPGKFRHFLRSEWGDRDFQGRPRWMYPNGHVDT